MIKDNVQYEIFTNRVIGKEGLTTVYEGMNILTRENIAAKHIDPEFLDEIKYEFSEMSKVSSDNITKYYDLIEEGGEIYLIMEKADMNLEDCIQERRKQNKDFSICEILEVMEQLFSGLNIMHSNDILHQNINCENILVFTTHLPTPVYKLCNFGLPKRKLPKYAAYEEDTESSYYEAPECICDSKYSKKSDIWLMGVVMYYLCNHRSPYNGDTPEDIKSEIIATQLKDLYFRKELPTQIVIFIKALLASDINQRLSCEEAINTLGKIKDQLRLLPK